VVLLARAALVLLWFWLADPVFISFSLKYRAEFAKDTRPAGTLAAQIQGEKQLMQPTCGLGGAKLRHKCDQLVVYHEWLWPGLWIAQLKCMHLFSKCLKQ